MLFMVIEHFKHGSAPAIYERFQSKGRMLPDGLKYIDSWIDVNLERCFQLMECADAELFQAWIAQWSDLVDFEVIPVRSSSETANAVLQDGK
jgi:Protein of unknown function (DUF3303)